MNKQMMNGLLESMMEHLELPDSAYEKAASRYQDLGEWLCREEATCAIYEPHIVPQGSFCLGTAIRPLDEKEEYDLDLVCKLPVGITKNSHAQKSVKVLVGNEIESYRLARGIKDPKEEKHRCWRLDYADHMSFHMDIVPCIPEVQSRRQLIREAMAKVGVSYSLADTVSELAVSITDNRHPRYVEICEDWNTSNPEGYAKWFESRMKLAPQFLLQKAGMLRAASIDDLPVYKWKTPLQSIIQLLKRHRDQMFKDDPDIKPISIIITTLAAEAYQGESDLEFALENILLRVETMVRSKAPRIPNPVDPNEDFADRWAMPDCRHLKLEENFWNWVKQARADFDILARSDDTKFIAEQAKRKFSVSMDPEKLGKRMGLAHSFAAAETPKVHIITGAPAKPWARRTS
ncbi:MAG: nucleotidyltransferase [bacterium]|nr:nucleotidyltransferase [bacterium]